MSSYNNSLHLSKQFLINHDESDVKNFESFKKKKFFGGGVSILHNSGSILSRVNEKNNIESIDSIDEKSPKAASKLFDRKNS